MSDPFYSGAPVSDTFMKRWRTRRQVGSARPWARVSVRRGFLHHGTHVNEWPNPQFGQIVGRSIRDQWWPTWRPTTDWVELPGVASIDLDQQVNYAGSGGNGLTVATIQCDNTAWVPTEGGLGDYHVKQRGWLWPWRGYTPKRRPGSGLKKNQWYDMLPNAQILIEQGYGPDTAVKTFTGLIDNIGPGSNRPDRVTLTARDFGSLLVDRDLFAWNKDSRLHDPMTFIPHNYPSLKDIVKGKGHNWVIINDATDIVRCALRWSGFKEWQIEDSGVNLKVAYPLDRSTMWIEVINQVAEQLGYVFFIAEPSDNDLSMGVPVFRRQSVLRRPAPQPKLLNSDVLTDFQPVHTNQNDRFIIRVRGALTTRAKGGRVIIGGDMTIDGQVRFTFVYYPPWIVRMAGVDKHLTYYNTGTRGVLGFTSTRECRVAAILIAIQIALSRDTALAECPGQPGIGVDSFAYVNDSKASGIASRLYVTGRKSTMTLDNAGGSSNQLRWSTQLSGSLVDNPEWDQLVHDYAEAIAGRSVPTHDFHGKFI